MLFRYFLSYVALFLSVTGISQTLTISSAANSSSNWGLSGGVLTVSGTANIQASVIENALANGDLLIQGSTTSFIVNVNQAINSTTSGSNLTIGSLTNTGAVTISSSISVAGGLTVYGGNIAVNQDLTSTLSGSDILLQATGAISLAASKVIQTANGDITFRSNASGTAVVTPNSTTGAITLNSGSSLLSTGGNITLGGNFDGSKGDGLYATSALSGGSPGILINNATLNAAGGNINIYGKCSTSYDDGIRLQANISTTGSGNIGIYGEAFGGLTTGSPNVWFGGITFITNSSTIETENGNINVEGVLTNTQSNSTYAINFYRSVYTSGDNSRDIQIISKTGDIQITADRGATAAGGMGHSSWGDIYFGSPLNSAWTATGDVMFSYSSFVGAGVKGYKVKTSGAVTYEPTATSFVDAQTFPYNSYYTLAAEASSLFLGKAGNTANISVASAVSIDGPIDIQGGYVEIDGNLTSTAAGDIFIKGVAGTNPSIEIQSGKTITKSGGLGTLTLQGHGRVLNEGSITTSGTGVLNVIFWSDFDNDNDDGGVSQQGTISTNGGHVWLGGSNTNGGSYTWNGLEVGDGPSIGTTNFNSNAMNIYGNITTNGGDFLAWAGSSTVSGGIDGIASDGSGDIVSVGSGNIVLITDMVYGSTGAAMYFTQSGGTFTLVPFEGSFNAAFNWNPVVQTYIGSTADDYNLQGANFDWLGIGELNSISRLTIGYYNGMLNNGTPVEFTNSSDITFNTATTAAGAVELYGGTLALNANLNTTNTSTGNILLQGTTITGTGNIGLAAGRTATINVSANSSYAGLISGTGSGLNKLGAGLLTLTNDHTYTGATNINDGDLQVGTGGSLTAASSGSISNTSGVVVASGSELILSPNENITFAAPISGAGGIEIKGTSGSYYNAFLTATPATIVSNSSVLEVLTRITAGLQRGGAISTGSGEVAGAYHKNYNASANTATLQFQQYDGTFTKCVFVRLSQSGTNVQISANTAIYNTGAAYRSGNTLGTDMSTGSTSQYLATSSTATGYGISKVYMSGKVNFTGALTYTGNTVLSNTITNGTSPTTHYYVSKGTQEITDASSAFPSASAVVNNGLVIFNRATAITIASDLSGTEEVLQVGAPITLSGTCTHSGQTTIDLNKSLIVGNGATAGSITGNIINYGTLTFSRSDNSSYPGIISGSGALVKSGSGEHTLTGLHTFTGATTINEGKLIISRDVPAFSSSSVSGTGELVIQPTTTSFTNAVSYPITGITVGSIGGLTLGKTGNLANITFESATSVAGPITAYGGQININSDMTSTQSGAAILLQGSKVIQTTGTTVQANAGDITYTAANTPWTDLGDQAILVGTTAGNSTTIDAQGGNISLSGTFATTGVTNTSTNSDAAVYLRNTTVRTNGSGTISINGNAYENASTTGDFIWGVNLVESNLIQTNSGHISITGTPGKIRPNGRGVIADGSTLKVLSASGNIQITDAMPAGHTLTNYSGAYFKPASANAIQFGADGSLVTSSSSPIIFEMDNFTFDVYPTLNTTTGAVTIRSFASSFLADKNTTNITLGNGVSSFTFGKTGNTADLTLSAATTINGPITLYGGALTLSAALSTTNTTTGNMSLNGTTLSGGSLSVADGRTLTMNLSSNSNYAGSISGSSLHFVKDGAGTLTLPTPTSFSFADLTIEGGTFQLNANQQLTLTGTLTNDATFTLESGATFVQGTSVTGTGTYNIKQTIDNGAGSGSTLTGRYWYLGSPLQCARATAFGSAASLNKVWAYTNPSGYTALNDGDILQPTAGYVHRRSDASTTLAFSGQNLYAQDETLTLGNTVGTYTGWHLKSNPYTAYLDWHEVFAASTNISPTYYIRSYNSTGNDVDALISYNQSTELAVDNTALALSNAQARYLAPLQAFWVKVSASAGTSGTLSLSRSYTSHETGNIGLKSSTIFPMLARVNLVDDVRFDQMLVFMNQDMTNGVDQYDSEKMFVSGVASIYTMASGKKLVMNGLKNNKKKISVPLYLELPTSKVYQLQLSEYIMENGLILLEDKQEGTIQDFTINTIYSFYANSGLLSNRFVLHFMAPDNGIGAQGPSNNWVEEENAINEGGSILVSSNGRGKVTIQQDIDQSSISKGGVVIRDANGKVVYNGQLTGSATTLELNTPSGIYFVEVELNGQVEMKKIFVQQ